MLIWMAQRVSRLKSPEFKVFFAERLINIQLDHDETKSVINYFGLNKNRKSTEDILLYARLKKKKPSISKIVEIIVISFIVSATLTMITNGGLPKEPSDYIIGVISMLIIVFITMKKEFLI